MMYRKYAELSNGQVAMIECHRDGNLHKCETWTVAVIIGHHRKECRRAMRRGFARMNKGRTACDVSTGKCGLEGLRVIKALLEEFTLWVDGAGKKVNIVCTPYDDKRKRAYKYLLRMGYWWHEESQSYWLSRWW
jgi:hypothetical protein